MFGAANDSYALIIDDDRDQYELTEFILSLEGYSVLTADNVRDAIKLFNKFHPFVIITDFSMPDIDGAALIKTLRSDGGSDTPIIIVSAYSPEYIKKRLHPGFFPDVILSKPIDFNQLLETVKRFSDTEDYFSRPMDDNRQSHGLTGY
jgi:CheY-like chemotaxis protein